MVIPDERTAETAETSPEARLLPREILIGLALSGTSGAAILAHTFLGVPMSFTSMFVVIPTSVLLILAILFRRRLYNRLHLFSRVVALGASCGLLATIAYDIIRPLLQLIFSFHFYPFKAIGIFGVLITGRPVGDPISTAAGWTYHFWNGISFGMIFALFRPRGGVLAGMIWGLGLQLIMMATYPRLLQVRLDDPGFMVTGLVGHTLWGAVLGHTIRKWGRDG